MDQVEEIKARVDIVDFIRQYLDLKKAGVNYSAPCPFHNEKTPSFMVSPERQSFRCFGCGEGGDVISFFQKIEGLSFPEALKLLGERVGIQVQFSKEDLYEKKSEKELIYQINLLAAKYFKLSLHDRAGSRALSYLVERGLSEATIEKLKIGFAPAESKLPNIFSQKKISFDDLSKAGHPERFKHRIMFPIFDNFGSIIGFSGRIIEDGLPKNISPHPKYLNTPETAVFHKSKALYGINFAKDSIRQNKRVLVVEGQMDVAMAHEAGIGEVVASSGTALTQDHLKALSRLTDNIIFSFDEDEAGRKASISAVEMALEMGLEIKLTKIDGAKDVGELVKKDKDALREVIKKALPPVEWLAQAYKPPLDASQKKHLVREALNFIARFQNEIERSHYISYLARLVSVAEVTIEKVLNSSKINRRTQEESTKEAKTTTEERFIACLLNCSDQLPKIALPEIELEDSSLLTIYKQLQSCYNTSQAVNQEIGKIKGKLSRELRERLDAVSLEWDEKFAQDKEASLEEFQQIKSHLMQREKEQIKSNFAKAIAQAETSGDIAKVRELMKNLQESLK